MRDDKSKIVSPYGVDSSIIRKSEGVGQMTASPIINDISSDISSDNYLRGGWGVPKMVM
jgi:hypothetical protein